MTHEPVSGKGNGIRAFPDFTEIKAGHRALLDPPLRRLEEGISEFTFAGLYLFRKAHEYRISSSGNGVYVISGNDRGDEFFMLPFGLPETGVLDSLFMRYKTLKCATVQQVHSLSLLDGKYKAEEDRDNFDYLYRRSDLSTLPGKQYHNKRNLIRQFTDSHSYEARPLLEDYLGDAFEVLEKWRSGRENPGDYEETREALEKMEELVLCGGIYYADGSPAAFTLGEEIMGGTCFVIHFEKALPGYRGLWQYINQAFSSILPEKYIYINREQDLGDEGLRQAKKSYNPSGFVKKYRITLRP